MDIEILKNIDIYLLDQLLRGRIDPESQILDVGCGDGRNLTPLSQLSYNIEGFDTNVEKINNLKKKYPKIKLSVNDLINDEFKKSYDFIICNAVLHFAKNHTEFDIMIENLVSLTSTNGLIFIRMTSDLAKKTPFEINSNGVSLLPDNTYRYLLTKNKLNHIIETYNLILLDPIKTVNVDNLRCMTTLVLKKQS